MGVIYSLRKESVYLSLAVVSTLLSGVLTAVMLKRGRRNDTGLLFSDEDVFFSAIAEDVLHRIRQLDYSADDVLLIHSTVIVRNSKTVFYVITNTPRLYKVVYYPNPYDIKIYTREAFILWA